MDEKDVARGLSALLIGFIHYARFTIFTQFPLFLDWSNKNDSFFVIRSVLCFQRVTRKVDEQLPSNGSTRGDLPYKFTKKDLELLDFKLYNIA